MNAQHGMLKGLLPWFAALAAAIVFHYAANTYIDDYVVTILAYAGINITLAVSLNLVNGFTGQFSMGHAGFMAVGAYASAFFTTELVRHYPQILSEPMIGYAVFVLALILGGLVAAFAGWVVGLPTLRLRGDYLAIVTLGFGEIIRVIILNIDAVGGPRGMPNIPAFSSLAWIYGIAVVTVFFVWRLIYSNQGHDFVAVREDEIAAEAMGVNTTRAKTRAFVYAAFFAGIAGGLFAHQLRYINPQSFDFNRSFEIIIMVVLGGMGSISGSVLAALLLTILREALRPLQELTQIDFRMVIYSLFLIVLMLTRPNGLFGTREIRDVFTWMGGVGRRKEIQS